MMRRLLFLITLALAFAWGLARPAAAEDRLLVFAAASLKNALDDANAAYQKQSGVAVAASYAASGTLARQIENGAPADLFISADLDWMDYLEGKKLIRPETRRTLLGNALVLVAPSGSTLHLVLAPGADLAGALGDGRLAIGDPQSVPAGKYARSALESLGLWPQVEAHLARTESVRAALALVSRREVPLGIVYATDAKADPGVDVVATFPESSHAPIVYPAAALAAGNNPKTAAFLDWLGSPAAAEYFTRQGFAVLR
jgi:molybdate transport system substrate-binding protein